MRRILCAGVVLVAALTFGACEDEPEAIPGPEPSMIPSDSSSGESSEEPSGPAEPTLPAEATKRNRSGAAAFVRYYWEVVNDAQETGDTTVLRNAQTNDCTSCTAGADWVDDVYERGGRIVGGEHTVHRTFAFQAPSGPQSWLVEVTVVSEESVVRGAGELNDRYPRDRFQAIFTLNYGRGQWLVSDWDD